MVLSPNPKLRFWHWAIIAFFSMVYLLIALVNHYCFRTYALDLGAYTNAIYDYAHGRFNDATVFKEQPRNLLSDHLDFSLILISPISLLLGQYTLQVMQIVFVLLGGLGIYRFLLEKKLEPHLALIGTVHFYLFFGVYAALSFDYHSNVLAAMLMPWFWLKMEQKKHLHSALFLLLMLICKESVALWLVNVCVALAFIYRKERKTQIYALVFAIVSLLYFVMAVQWLMPALSPDKTYGHFKYHVLGNSYGEALLGVFQSPFHLLKSCFINHSQWPLYDWVKTEFYVFALLSGAVFLFFKPQYLLMLVVPILSKMCYDDPAIWSIDCHYSIEFAPILTVACFLSLSHFKSPQTRQRMAILLCVFSLAVSIRLMDHTIYLHDYNRLRIYQKGHYSRGYSLEKVHRVLDAIPADAIVSAQSPLLPHLAYRDLIYHFPIVKDAQYIVLSRIEPVAYPIENKEMQVLLERYKQSGDWETVYDSAEITLLKKRQTKASIH